MSIHPFPRPTVAHRVPMRHTAPMVEVLVCGDCGSSDYDICAIPGQHGPDHLCINCAVNHGYWIEYITSKVVQVGTRLAEPQLQRVRDHIDRLPTIPANNSYGPHTAEDWGVSPVVPLVVVAAALTVAGVVLAVLSWATGWML